MQITGYMTVIPSIILLLIFSITPILYSFRMSFYEWSFYKDITFIGLDNYEKVVSDKRFWQSIGVSFQFMFWNMSITMILSLFIALCIKRMGRFAASATKVLIYIPTIIGGVVVSYIFGFMYSYRYGLFNSILRSLGLGVQRWTDGPATAMLSIILPSIWTGCGVKTLIFLAGINDINPAYYEAAALDGAGEWKQLWYITLPCLKNIALYLLVTGSTAAMQMWDLSNFLTAGGPQGMTTTTVLYVYTHFKDDKYLGPSLAAALILAVILGSISWITFKTINSDKNIDG